MTLQLVSVSLSKGSVPDADHGFTASKISCLFLCSAPLVAVAILLMAHALILNIEQVVRQISYAKYMVLVSNAKLARIILGECSSFLSASLILLEPLNA